MEGTVRIVADRDRCVAAGQCALVADELFDQDDDGIVVVLEEQPGADAAESARRAAALCPARAITLAESS